MRLIIRRDKTLRNTLHAYDKTRHVAYITRRRLRPTGKSDKRLFRGNNYWKSTWHVEFMTMGKGFDSYQPSLREARDYIREIIT